MIKSYICLPGLGAGVGCCVGIIPGGYVRPGPGVGTGFKGFGASVTLGRGVGVGLFPPVMLP